MTNNRSPLHSQLELEENFEPYTLSGTLEIAFHLRLLQNRQETVSAYFDHGKRFFLTRVLQVDAERRQFVFDPVSDQELVRRLMAAERTVFVAAPDGVKTQFVCVRVVGRQDSDGPVLVADFPDHLIKLQRREYYRVETPIINPLFCHIGEPQRLRLSLHDLSLGGLGLVLAQPAMSVEPMAVIEECRMELPGFGTLRFDLEVRNVHTVIQKNGAQQLHLGCRFLRLDHKQQGNLQRYMVQLERERRSLLAG